MCGVNGIGMVSLLFWHCWFHPLTLKDRNKLLRQWVESGGQPDACEACVVMKRDDMQQLESGKDLMTVGDMIKAGFSSLLGWG